ncbi:MAG: CDP-alcohol phosphatidyltransferase [Methylococcaceae bacterium]|nr:MAG: CDP-alcohol phosphatidyltransferase [Methylococcaceae bacterium]
MNQTTRHTLPWLIRWSEWHAALMLVVGGFALASLPQAWAAAGAALSFAGLLVLGRRAWTPDGRFGAANAVTLLRCLATLMLAAMPALGVAVTVGLALVILLLDGLDGWLARRAGTCSEFGEYFDKEVDAFFMLVLCLILYRDQHLGAWVLLPGGLRYLFVWFLKIAQPPRRKETATRYGKFVGVFSLGVLMFCLLPLPHYCAPLAAAATLALLCSFALSLRQIYAGSA